MAKKKNKFGATEEVVTTKKTRSKSGDKKLALKEDWKTVINEALGMNFKGSSRCCRSVFFVREDSTKKIKTAVSEMVKVGLLVESHVNEEMQYSQYRITVKACDAIGLPTNLRVRAGVCR
jgi:hypothetical protein